MVNRVASATSQPDIDVRRLRDFLINLGWYVPEDLSVIRIGGGQSNPTYSLRVDAADVLLRRRPFGELSPSAHDVAREYRIISALQDSAVAVPRPIALCEDAEVIGSAFYLMERLPGRVFTDARLANLPLDQRRPLYRDIAKIQAALHSINWHEVGLGDLSRPGSFLSRQIDRWIRAWGDVCAAETKQLHEWLLAHQPEDEQRALIHGDFKVDNIIVHASLPRVAGVLDWELAGIGDPLLDVAHTWCSVWSTTPDEYGGTLGVDLHAEGLPTADEYLSDYYDASASVRPLLPFYRVLALLRWSGIFWGIYQRSLAGTAASADAATQGAKAQVFLGRAVAVMESYR